MKKLVILCVLICFAFFSCKDEEKSDKGDSIKIGLLLPVLKYREWSDSLEKSAQIAIDEINSAGGIGNRKLSLVISDDRGDENGTALAAKDLIEKSKVVAIVGPMSSSSVISSAKEAAIPNNIPLITPTGTSDEITNLEDNSCVWRTIPKNSLQAEVLAAYLIAKTDKKKASILFVNSSYGKDLAEKFKASFIASGGTIVQETSFENKDDYSDYNFAPKLEELFKEKADIIFTILTTKEAKLVFTAIANKLDIYIPHSPLFVGADALFSNDFLENSPEIVNNMLIITPGNRDTENFQTLDSLFNAKYGANPNNENIENMYDAVFILGLAILEGNSTESDSIKKHLLSVSKSGEKIKIGEVLKAKEMIEQGKDIDYEGTGGGVDFDDSGDVTASPFTIYEVKNKQFVKKEIL